MAAIKYWVWLSALRMTPRGKLKLMERFREDPERMYFSTPEEIEAVEGLSRGDRTALETRELDTANFILGWCEQHRVQVITMQDAAYPQRLRNIYAPPVVLYSKGRLPDLDEEAAIAVIGTRSATPYGLKMATRFGHDLTACGAVLVTGATRGIERAAVDGAFHAGGRVVAVLGTGHDRAKEDIYEDIAAYGAVVSEYPPGAPTYKDNFRNRNRITAGLSAGVLVVEAPAKSGAIGFANEALEQGKDLFAVPGNADADNCAGSNELLKTCAQPVTKAWDILSEYTSLYSGKLRYLEDGELKRGRKEPEEKPDPYADFVQVRKPNPKKVIDKPETVEYIDLEKQLECLNEAQLKLVAVMGKEAVHIDDLIDATGLPASVVNAELTMLQIDGMVTQEPGKRFSLNVTRGL